MTDQSIPEALKGKTFVFTRSNPAAPPGHRIAVSAMGMKVYLIRGGEIVGRLERWAGVSHMYVGSSITGGLYRGSEGDATVALALIAEAAERGRAAAGAWSAGPAPEPEPSWLPGLRNGMWNPISKAFDANGLPHGIENVTNVSAAAAAYAATYLRPLHAEVAESKRELDALRASLRARDARIAQQDEEIDAFGAEIATNSRTIIRQAAEIDALRKWIAKQAAANAWAKATAARPEHLPASATAEAYLGEVGPATDDEESAPSPGMREVPAGEWRDGDTIRGIWHQHAPQSGKGCLPFAESRMGGLTEVMATRTVAPLPTNQHAVIRCIAMRGTTVRDAREIVAELRYDCWHGTDRYTYRPQDIVRVIAVLSPGDEIPAPPIKRETVESLPTLPGSVGKATVAKLGRTRVFLLDAESKYPWAALTDQGYDWFETSDLADYEPELDGQEA